MDDYSDSSHDDSSSPSSHFQPHAFPNYPGSPAATIYNRFKRDHASPYDYDYDDNGNEVHTTFRGYNDGQGQGHGNGIGGDNGDGNGEYNNGKEGGGYNNHNNNRDPYDVIEPEMVDTTYAEHYGELYTNKPIFPQSTVV
mmetsp:Transcript_8481/g.12051  ORF Transcript_8481/g.12051 Transcript_8481/m.12051 type:complete len:140 (+) Transcript_8481:745-1164(+)